MDDVYTLVGMRDVSFKGNDGSQVSGQNFFLTYENDKITGVGVEKIFISNSKFADLTFVPELNDQCRLLYNKYGKVADIVKA